MSYSAEISRTNPSCFLFLIDQSYSMTDQFFTGEIQMAKATGVSDAINKLLQNLVIKCSKDEGVRDYYYVGVIGYGNSVATAFAGPLSGKELISISEVANNPARVEERLKKVADGAGGIVETNVKFPVWFDPIADNGTPMCEAFSKATSIIQNWLIQHPESFPPVVINITDGESSDGNPINRMKELTSLSSSDGNVLLFNLNLSSHPNAKEIKFPNTKDNLPDDYARMLFDGSSNLTQFMINLSKEEGIEVKENAKAFVLNSSLEILIKALEIGTRPSNLR